MSPSSPRSSTTPPLPAPSSSALPPSRAPRTGPRPGHPFGAHVRMRWWAPPIVVIVSLVATVGIQLALDVAAQLVEVRVLGAEPSGFSLSPLRLLGANLSLAASAVVSTVLMFLLARVPWREVLSRGRPFSWRALGRWMLVLGPLLLVASVAVSLLLQGMLSAFAITATTVGLLVVTVLTTPLQAASEEVIFRGAMMPAIASWARSPRTAIAIGIVGSSLAFGLVHAATDPWLIAYYTLFGVSAAAITVLSGGLEAAIAFLVANNLVNMLIAVLFADGGNITIDRSAGSGGPTMVLMIAADLLAVLVGGLLVRRHRAAQRA